MLRDSLTAEGAGFHVEQVEIVFTQGVVSERVVSAWEKTVGETEALRIAFLMDGGEPTGWKFVRPSVVLKQEDLPPASWESWLRDDRLRPLLSPHEVPWRATWWPGTGRFIWTFHHALLDGRSITEILRGFLKRLAGEPAATLAISRWSGPSRGMLMRAEQRLSESFSNCMPLDLDFLPAESNNEPATRCLGAGFLKRLESIATGMEVTAATILTWAWGQTLLGSAGTDAVMLEQVRCGPRQQGTAGFRMNTLPVLVDRTDGDPVGNLRAFREQLMTLREIEPVSPGDFPSGVFPDMNSPWSSVIMIEHGTLHHMAGAPAWVESLRLHECKGETLMATAYVMPDLRLEVEGPQRHFLLAGWIRELETLVSEIDP